MNAISAYPLCWPPTVPRYKAREKGSFKTTLAAALNNVETSLRRFGTDSDKPISNIVLSSNVTLGANRPQDPGVAVWFVWDGVQVCIPVDRYSSTEANLQAIHHIIEARRVELRHGTLALVRASFQGFRALPAPAEPHWSEILRCSRDADLAEIDLAFRRAARTAHPDAGGSNEKMARLNAAREAAMKERG
ncbi:MAG: J domain-containing protein [Alphaproteobacteria bacterium]|nr:J domain-containing protein [Alphaproteobacteria bacterium]OJU57336.1 MAG: molecular chaperone DnaJ [Alphaproteobacteria bacterium 62-8]